MAKKEKSKHPYRETMEMVVFAIVMALGLKVFALEAYQIPTGSMMPTLMGTDLWDEDRQVPNGAIHDRVLVDKVSWWVRDPQRWEVVVFRYPLLAHQNYVKRLIGLPGEDVFIRHGDIWTRQGEGEEFKIARKPNRLQESIWKRALPAPGRLKTGSPWVGWDTAGQVPNAEGELALAPGRAVRTASSIHDEYRHGFQEAIARRIPVTGHGQLSRHVVSDLRTIATLTPAPDAGPLRIKIQAGPWPFTLTMDQSREVSVSLAMPDGTIAEQDFDFSFGEPLELDLAFWDHRLRLQLEGSSDSWEMEKNFDLEARDIASNRVSFFAEQGGWTVTRPTIWRDLYYLPPLRGGGAPLFQVPEGQYFMMGDNTQNSHDGRDWEARELTLNPPVDGLTHLRGDNFRNGMNPSFDNPRWNRDHSLMVFRDQFGEVFEVPKDSIANDDRVPANFVPREFLMGRALCVFMPLWPLSPVNRIGLVR